MSLNSAHEGYDYQDLVTCYFIMEEILNGHMNSVFSIDKKNTESDIPDRFDDLVIIRGSERYRKQIKYSNEQTAIKLTKDYLSADSYYSLAIHKLYESWVALKESSREFRLCLAWDEPEEDNIIRVLDQKPDALTSFVSFPTKVYSINLDRLWETSPEKFNRWDSLRRYVNENHIDRDDFNNFCRSLLIEVNFPKASLDFQNPSDLESILIEQARKLGVEQYPNNDIYINDFLVRFAKIVGTYRTKSSLVSVNQILNELRIKTDFGKIEQKFEINHNFNISEKTKYSSFYNKVIKNKKTILTGEPGSGKSWFLTNFIDYLERENNLVLRHYCFTSTEDDLIDKRISYETFFGNLIHDLEKAYPHLSKFKSQKFAANLDELNILLGKLEEPLIIIVDGLDHIKRVFNSSINISEEKTRILEFISKIILPDHIDIVLGSQPVSELSFLKDEFSYIEEKMPKWDEHYTKELMHKYGYDDVILEGSNLSSLLHNKSEGSPLYLTYILLTLKSHGSVTKDIINTLPKYDFNLKNYYEYLTSRIKDNVTSEILSCLDFSVNRQELKEIIPIRHHFDSNMEILSPVISENAARGGIKLYHDSFRRFVMEKLSDVADIKQIYKYIVNWLKLYDFYENDKSYRYLLNYLIKMEEYEEVKLFAKNKFLSQSLYYAHPESLIRNNFNRFIFVARETKDWELFIYAGELKRAIESTCSEERYSQFLESFELYFEAVCLIYGPNKANSLLYYYDEKNYSDNVMAKAFRILEHSGFSPEWSDIESLFKEGVYLDDFKYYVNYISKCDDQLSSCFNKIIEKVKFDFLKVFIEEVYIIKGFSYIEKLYSNLNDNAKDACVVTINRTLGSINCDNLIHGNDKIVGGVLNPLPSKDEIYSLSDDKLNEFYFNAQQYANEDIESLINLENDLFCLDAKSVWTKFFIKTLVMESACDKSIIEKAALDNLTFIANNDHLIKHRHRYLNYSSLIETSFDKIFKQIKSKKSWDQVFDIISGISYSVIHVVEKKFLNDFNIKHVIKAYETLEIQSEEGYTEHAEYSFKKSIYFARVGKFKKAKKELEKAIHYITSYTYRKDRNLAEVIEPLVSVNRVNSKCSKKYARKLKDLTDAVMKHTEDGKDTRWLTIEWFEVFLKVDRKTATKYLINEFLLNGKFWKLEFMFVELLQSSTSISPLILNFLYRLSPTNTKDHYLSGYLDVINKLEESGEVRLAELSLLNLTARDWNNSYDTLSKKTLNKYLEAGQRLGVSININENVQNEYLSSSFDNKPLASVIEKRLNITEDLSCSSLSEFIDHFNSKDTLEIQDLNILYFITSSYNDSKLVDETIIPIISKEFPRGHKHFKNLRRLITRLSIDEEQKIRLLINNFVHSKDGYFSGFVDRKSLRAAVDLNKEKALEVLSQVLPDFYLNKYFYSKSTANLIISFEYSGLGDYIVPMYEKGFKFIKSRLPYDKKFEWNSLDYLAFNDFSDDEVAIVLLLSKTSSFDASIQKEVILALSYILNFDHYLLIKPLKWFFSNLQFFHHMTIASIIEILSVESGKLIDMNIEKYVDEARGIGCLYINNTLDYVYRGVSNE
ncbi:TPA: ATP-binding protein [Vibrio parahaemolyticus]|nr:ATP-binding protein [Vibrio parahaemolyticus]HBN6269479.1 ATP-binding protein [Vibrio parahaemolyticus]